MANQYSDNDLPSALLKIISADAIDRGVSTEVDARGLACPLPLLKAKQALRNSLEGELVRVLTTDAGSLKDFVSFSQLTGQVLESFCIQENYYCFVLRKH